jgi:hypothetical protein
MSTTTTTAPDSTPAQPAPAGAASTGSLTRLTARFARFAQYLDDACRARGVEFDARRIDQILNDEIAHLAASKGLAKRTALRGLHPDAIGPLAAHAIRAAAG